MTKREQILIAAEELFAERGFDGTSVRELAEKADVNVAMISYYFGSKEKLFESLVEYRSLAMREQIQGLNKDYNDPVLRIEGLIDLYVDKIFSNPGYHRILHRQISLQQRSDLNNAIISILIKNLDAVSELIRQGINDKVFREIDVEMFIATLLGTISQVILSSLFCTKLMGESADTKSMTSDKIKERVKVYLKDLSRKYLLN